MQRKNLTARAASWSARHRRVAILGWMAFVVTAIVLGSAIGTKHISSNNDGVGESARADRIINAEFPQYAGEQVLIQSKKLTVRDPAFEAAVRDVVRRVSATGTVQKVRSPLAPGNRGEISRDGHSALVSFQIAGDQSRADDQVGASLAATAAAQKAHPSLRIEQAGDASADKALNKSFNDDFAKARTLSLPITLLILIVAFGALVAAGIPVLLAITGVGATLGLVGLVSHLAPVDPAVSEVVLLIGMAVGVDYSLFYMRREREERAAGRGEQAALEAAAATSGRSVLISGFTVMAAMAGMYLAGNKTFASMATGTILVVAVAVLGSLTVLPALLSKLGDKVMKGGVPFVARRRERGGEARIWGAIVDRVLRHPGVAAVTAGGIVVALAIPAIGIHTSDPGLQGLPKGLPIVKTLDRMQAAFPGGAQPAHVVVQARDVRAPQVRAAIGQLERRALATGQMHQPFDVQVSRDHTVADVSIPLSGQGTDSTSYRALDTLRGEVIPATIGGVPGVKALVAGETAGAKDFNDSMKSHLPVVFAFVLTMTFLLLLITFRSIVIPLTAIVLNMLSVGAAYGVLALVFQHSWAEGLLGFKSTGAITSWLPLFLFVILFGLSMDYHVFILSRVREAYDKGMSTSDAVAHAIKSTAGPVTGAAVVMVAVFAIFASLGALEFKQLGVGLAVAILLDATLIRAVLLPAVMKLLGDANWYLPKRLDWLPRLEHEPARA
ncbi:MAG TPA: MMPL family transporter [Solirubrobacteraceae bacterium]|nr:MMPL family transporter [Solirubrobacteraceae bacterium]